MLAGLGNYQGQVGSQPHREHSRMHMLMSIVGIYQGQVGSQLHHDHVILPKLALICIPGSLRNHRCFPNTRINTNTALQAPAAAIVVIVRTDTS